MFSEEKYQKCIKHLKSIKTSIVLVYTITFLAAGFAIGFFSQEDGMLVVGSVFGGVLGFVIGLSSTWRIEMHIQESYWRIEMLRELKSNNTCAVKTSNVEKVVAKSEEK